MSKKIILLALAVASVAAFALPATALAAEEDEAVHLVPVPSGTKTIDGEGGASLTGSFGAINCTASSGTATFESGTTGVFTQKFTTCAGPTGTCTSEGLGLPSGTITTTELPFHLVTVLHEHNAAITGPGVLVTPNKVSGVFAHFSCPLFPNTTVTGNGLIGTITKPACKGKSTEGTITFQSKSSGVQTHTTVVSTETGNPTPKATPTSYGLQAFGGAASEDASGIITLGAETELECT